MYSVVLMMAMTTGLPPEHYTHYRRRRRPDPMVERRLVREVDERVDYKGDVIVQLDRVLHQLPRYSEKALDGKAVLLVGPVPGG